MTDPDRPFSQSEEEDIPHWVGLVRYKGHTRLGRLNRQIRRVYCCAVTVGIGGLVAAGASAWGRHGQRLLFVRRLVTAAGIGLAIPVVLLKWVRPLTTPRMACARLGWQVEDPVPASVIHEWVSLERVAPAMKLAVLASEDPFFFWHMGLNPILIWREFWYNRRKRPAGGMLHGGSTLSQQVAKNLFLLPAQSYWRKVIEVLFTLLLEGLWSKRRILEMYLNVVHFGQGAFGVQAAAMRFWGQPASTLTKEQAALLTAALRRPFYFRVTEPSPRMLELQQYILKRMSWFGDELVSQLDEK